jgi:type IV pilus assembly protein PilB
MARRIGQILIDLGFIDEDQLEVILEEQLQQPGEQLGKVAEDMGLITDAQLCQAIAEQFNMQVVHLAEAQLSMTVLNRFGNDGPVVSRHTNPV